MAPGGAEVQPTDSCSSVFWGVKAAFDQVEAAVKARGADLVICGGATFLLNVNGEMLYIDLRAGSGYIKRQYVEETDVMITMMPEVFLDIFSGQVDGKVAYSKGLLSAVGDLSLALKLGPILEQARGALANVAAASTVVEAAAPVLVQAAAVAAQQAQAAQVAFVQANGCSAPAAREAAEMRATLSAVLAAPRSRAVRTLACAYCGQVGHVGEYCPVLEAEVDADLGEIFGVG